MEAGEVDRLVVGLAYQVDAATEAKAKASAAAVEDAADEAAAAWRVGLQGAALAAATAVAGLALSTAHAADEFHDLGIRMGLSVEEVQALGYAADRSGTSLEVLGAGLTTLQRQIGAARHGNKEAAEAFGALGLDPQRLAKAKDALPQVADALLKVSDDAERARLRLALLGEAGPRMAELLDQGADGIADLTRRAATFQGVITSAEADLAGGFLDDLDDLASLAKRAGHAVGFELIRPMHALVDEVHDWVETHADEYAESLADALAAIPAPVKAATLAALGLAGAWGAMGMARSMATAAAEASPLAGAILGQARTVATATAALGPYGLAVIAAGLTLEDFAAAARDDDAVVLRLAEHLGVRGEAQNAIKEFDGLLAETAKTAKALGDALADSIGGALDELAKKFPAIKPYLDDISEILKGGLSGALDSAAEAASVATSGGKAIQGALNQGGLSGLIDSGLLGPQYVAPGVYSRGGQLYVPTQGANGATVNVPVTINTTGLSPQQIADAAAAEVRRQVLDAQQALGGP